MTIRASLFLAAAVAACTVGLQTNSASAMEGVILDTGLASAKDHLSVDTVALRCNRYGCYRTYGYRNYGYGYRHYGYGYRPYRYGYVVPRLGFGFY